MRWAQRGRPAKSFWLAIAIQPSSAGMIAIETLAQPPNDLSLSVNTQTRSVLEILALAIPHSLGVQRQNKASPLAAARGWGVARRNSSRRNPSVRCRTDGTSDP